MPDPVRSVDAVDAEEVAREHGDVQAEEEPAEEAEFFGYGAGGHFFFLLFLPFLSFLLFFFFFFFFYFWMYGYVNKSFLFGLARKSR